MSDIDGAVVLVLGASGGLGSEISRLLVEQGALVVRAGRDPDRLTGPDAYLADLRTPDGAASLVAAALASHGRLDGVVVAAGVVAFGPAAEVADATLDELLDTNFVAAVRLIRAATPALSASKEAGRSPFVLTLSGIVAESPTAGMAAYSASKAALAAFVNASSREYRCLGIRLIDARPGHVSTSLSAHPVAGPLPRSARGSTPRPLPRGSSALSSTTRKTCRVPPSDRPWRSYGSGTGAGSGITGSTCIRRVLAQTKKPVSVNAP